MSDRDRHVAWLNNAADVLRGTGEHADHEREQVGRCVHCSCGVRVQGRMVGPPQGPMRWAVVAPDGFVCYLGTSREAAEERAAARPGYRVERRRAAP